MADPGWHWNSVRGQARPAVSNAQLIITHQRRARLIKEFFVNLLCADLHPGPMARFWKQDKCPSDAFIIRFIDHFKETAHIFIHGTRTNEEKSIMVLLFGAGTDLWSRGAWEDLPLSEQVF